MRDPASWPLGTEVLSGQEEPPAAPVLADISDLGSAFMWVSFAAGLLWALRLLALSPGVTTQDAIAHFVISREAWHRPALLLHHWGRPLDTVLYMPAARLGLVYARLTSLGLAGATVLLAVRLAQRLEIPYAFAVPVLLWFQPWFLQLSIQPSLSEIPFALMMVLAALLFLSARPVPASLLVGLMPLVRHEAIVLAAVWGAVMLLRKRWVGAVLTVLPLAAYAVLYRRVFGALPGGDFPIVPGPNMFGLHPHGNLLHFPKLLLAGAGLPVIALALYALPLWLRSAPRIAVAGWYALYLGVHFVVYHLGYAAGAGDQRYLFPAAPWLAVAAALGLGGLMREIRVSLVRLRPGRIARTRVAHALTAACLLAVLLVGLRVRPIPLDAEGLAAESAAEWLRAAGLAGHPIVATHVYVHYFLPGHLNPTRPGVDPEALWYAPPPLEGLPVGAIAIWDSHYSDRYGLSLSTLTSAAPAWKRLKTFDADVPGTFADDRARIAIFEKAGS